MAQTVIVDDPAHYIALLDDYKIEIKGVDQLNEECMMLTFEPLDEYMVENASSNLVRISLKYYF